MIRCTPFGTTPTGVEVHAWELSLGDVCLTVLDLGATIQALTCPDAQGQLADIVLGFDTLTGYLDNPACYGATIGPSANRSDKAEVCVSYNQWFELPHNDGPELTNNLHTDLADGLHKRMWAVTPDEAHNTLTLSCDVVDGCYGLPGNRRFTVSFSLSQDDDAACITETLHCDTDAATFVNLTNHSYVNLSGVGSGSALSHLVRIAASSYLPVREDSVSEGFLEPVAHTPFDFTELKALGADIEADHIQLARGRGYDHCFCIDGYTPDGAPRPALHVEDVHSGRVLDIAITMPGAHLYTGNWLSDAAVKGNLAAQPRDGFAFEPEYYPDASHNPTWPQSICTPEKPYHEQIVYRLSTR
ncbi:galactose mutarotase [Collinsella sp. zg1085]|uniref:aldose epimerase family protein n=1 Tax=Collinsella sp. zg1085 TaxID=2844380 RepID=UPI001C0E4B82|nr:aldose epimerase family protein [Collinsella sp. zg1085]QWT17440.1 galactose mutarotase [Collinsella sp. zg1085]